MFTELRIAAGRRPMTVSEARVSTIVGTLISLLFLAAIVDEYSARKLSILFFVLFWIPMLVVHELGHALAARALGWQVREIVIGFGRTLWQWQVGATRIKVKRAPLEGYVLPAPLDRQRVRLKSALIYAAGPGAEFLVLAGLLLVFGWDTVFNDSAEPGLVALKSLAVVIVVGAGFNLLPFQSDGAASDGLGILSSPFLPDEAIEMRLMTAQSREIGRMQDAGLHAEAKAEILRLQQRFPGNHWLQRRFGAALAASGSVDEARDYVRDKLDATDLDDGERRQWLKLQAEIELDAGQPAYLVLDLALQKALAITADAPDLLAIRGASLVERGKYADGGNILAHAWRSNDGTADDAMMLAYLAMAAAGVGDRAAGARFRDAFERTSRSVALRQKLDARTS